MSDHIRGQRRETGPGQVGFVDVFVVGVEERHALQLREPVAGVGLTVVVHLCCPREPVDSLLLVAGRQQGIRVGVAKTRRPWCVVDPELRDAQRQHGRVGLAEVRAGPRSNHPQFDAGRAVEAVDVRRCGDGQRPLRTAEATLAVGEYRQVLVGPRHPASRTQFRQRFGIATGRIGCHSHRLAHARDAGGCAAGGNGVLIRELGVLVEQAPRHDEVTSDLGGVGRGEGPQLLADVSVELPTRDFFRDLEYDDRGALIAVAPARSRWRPVTRRSRPCAGRCSPEPTGRPLALAAGAAPALPTVTAGAAPALPALSAGPGLLTVTAGAAAFATVPDLPSTRALGGSISPAGRARLCRRARATFPA